MGAFVAAYFEGLGLKALEGVDVSDLPELEIVEVPHGVEEVPSDAVHRRHDQHVAWTSHWFQGVPLDARPNAYGAGDAHVGEDVAVGDAGVADLAALDFGIASGLTVLAGLEGADVRDFTWRGKRAFASYLALCEPCSRHSGLDSVCSDHGGNFG